VCVCVCVGCVNAMCVCVCCGACVVCELLSLPAPQERSKLGVCVCVKETQGKKKKMETKREMLGNRRETKKARECDCQECGFRPSDKERCIPAPNRRETAC